MGARLASWQRVVVCLAWLGAALLFPTAARAEVSLCLQVKSDADDARGFDKLVRSEIARHPSHRLRADCESRLSAELFHLGATRYLTVRIDGEIPVRYAIADDAALELRLSDAISRVLRSDPAYLVEDPSRLSGTERLARSVLVRGHNRYRLALFETIVRTDTGSAFAPGFALEFARGADHVQVSARAGLAGSWSGVAGGERALRLLADFDVGFNYELSPRADTSAYAGLAAGLAMLRFEGRVEPGDATTLDRMSAIGGLLEFRVGARFFRLYDFDCDVFAIGALPLFATKDPDAQLFGDSGIYTPFAELGLAVGF
jgi:hypothetical protein